MEIKDAVVIVTGASSGIGESTARLASEAGARVVLVARREDRIQNLAKALDGALPVTADVTDGEQLRRLVDSVVDRYGRIDVLVNNAGQGMVAPVEHAGLDDVRALLELNVVAPIALMQATIPLMRAAGGGAIVNVSSGATFAPYPGTATYAGSKAALTFISSVARAELAADGIVVSTIFPFLTDTEFMSSLRGADPSASQDFTAGPQGHRPELVAEAILDLIRSGDARADLVPVRFGGTWEG